VSVRIVIGDCREKLREMEAGSVNTCVTSPPYFGLRDYGHDGQIGLEETPEAFVAQLVSVFREVRRVLRDDGTLWLNLGDSYNAQPGQRKVTDQPGAKQATSAGSIGAPSRSVEGLKPKDLIGIPWRVAFALQADGWYLRQDIIWAKPNPMPESVRDRCTKAHEYVFLLSKGPRYYFDADAIAEAATFGQAERKGGGVRSGAEVAFQGNAPTNLGRCGGTDDGTRNKRSVWTVATQPFKEAHFATYPPELIEPCILAGCPVGGTVLDPFGGAGTTGLVADRLQRNAVLCELNPAYADIALRRLEGDGGMFSNLEAA